MGLKLLLACFQGEDKGIGFFLHLVQEEVKSEAVAGNSPRFVITREVAIVFGIAKSRAKVIDKAKRRNYALLYPARSRPPLASRGRRRKPTD